MSEGTPIYDIFVSLSNNNTLPEKAFYASIDTNTLNEIMDYYILTKSQSVPKCAMQFLGLVLDAVEDDKEALLNGLSYLIKYIDVKNRSIRRNVIHLLGMLIDRLNVVLDGNCSVKIKIVENGKDLSIGSHDLVKDAIMKVSERLFDKEYAIRREAIKILSPYQGFTINKKTNVKRIFKDLLRYDPCPEIRNRVMAHLIMSSSAIERIKDEDTSVRQTFFRIVLPHLKLKNLSIETRCLILEKSVLEREFNAFSLLKSKLWEEYEFPDDMKRFVSDFLLLNATEYADDDSKLIEENKKHLTKVLEVIFREASLSIKAFDSTYYENLDLEGAFVLHAFLSFVESTQGRDSLELVNLEYFTAILYLKVKQVIEKEQNTSDFHFVSHLFQLTNFYDVYEQKQSKYILSTIYKFFTAELPPRKEMLARLIENGIILASSTERSTFTNFLGSLITKNRENHTFLFLLCKYVMMHVKPFEMLHTAIVGEIVLNNINKIDEHGIILEIIFYYLVEKYREDADHLSENTNKSFGPNMLLNSANTEDNEVKECTSDVSCTILLNLLLEEKYFRPVLVVDLFILFNNKRDMIRDKLVAYYQRELSTTDIDTRELIVPVTKCMLIEPERFLPFVGLVVFAYFNTKKDYIRQYLTVFLQEFVLINTKLVVGELFKITEIVANISHNKVFLDQVLCWLKMAEENGKESMSEELLFNLLIYFIRKNYEIHETSLRNGKPINGHSKAMSTRNKTPMSNMIAIFDFVAKRITVDDRFSATRIKQMIYCLGLIAKIGFSAKEKINVGDLSGRLMVFSDNIPITASEIEEITTKISKSD